MVKLKDKSLIIEMGSADLITIEGIKDALHDAISTLSLPEGGARDYTIHYLCILLQALDFNNDQNRAIENIKYAIKKKEIDFPEFETAFLA